MKALSVLLLFALCSCGTSKRSTETERRILTEIELSDSLFRRHKAERTELRLSEAMLNARIIIKEWSNPDSSGKQYPTKTTEVDLSQQKKKQVITFDQAVSEATLVKKQETKALETEKVKENIRKDNRFIPTCVWWFIGFGGIIVALQYWWSKRRK